MAFADAALGAVVGELLQIVKAVAKQTLNFKSNLKTLEKTLESVEPIFNEIDKLSRVLDRPKEETDKFIDQLDSAKKLVTRCSTIWRWNMFKLYVYSKKLEELDKCILKFFNIDVQGFVAVNTLKAAVGIDEIKNKLDLALKLNGVSLGLGAAVPGLPDKVVGFDQPLREIKKMLLKDKETVKVISAPGGCGKTTLAKMVCRDPEIKGMFANNILFVTVSKSANISVIVQKILKRLQPNCQLPDIQNDEDAINHLEDSLKQITPSPILLVLDDVWPDWESFIDNLTFTLPNYKILVTSRFSFPRFSPTYNLKILNNEDAMTLFCHSALPEDGSSKIPYDLVKKIVKGCKGFPLALTVIGRSLYGRPEVMWRREHKKWSHGNSIFDTNNDLLVRLQPSLDALDENDGNSLRDCCLDLGSFPEGQRIPATTLMDMWAELYGMKCEDMDTYINLVELAFRNLVNLVGTRQTGIEVDGYCNEKFVMQHDLLRDLTIHQSNREPIKLRKRLFIEITGNDLSKWSTEAMHQPICAHLLSVSTDKSFSSSWFDLTLPAAEVVVLNLCSYLYTIPQFIVKMNQLKVLVVTNYGSSFSKLYNFQLLGNLSNLRRIRLERVSISSLDTSSLELLCLQKISITMCDIGKAFEMSIIDLSLVFPNLLEIEIDCCDDLVKLHGGVCSIVSLKKISITYCNELSSLPEEIGRLTNLEVLRLNSCTKLLELPESIRNLRKLAFLDISDCLSLSKFPGSVGELIGLRKINMRGCQGLSDLRRLPSSVKDLRLLEKVICDEGVSRLWEPYLCHLKNLTVEEVKEDTFESLMRVISPILFP